MIAHGYMLWPFYSAESGLRHAKNWIFRIESKASPRPNIGRSSIICVLPSVLMKEAFVVDARIQILSLSKNLQLERNRQGYGAGVYRDRDRLILRRES
jgi:hypothetical protein